jgi:hypothetical protein
MVGHLPQSARNPEQIRQRCPVFPDRFSDSLNNDGPLRIDRFARRRWQVNASRVFDHPADS